MISKICFLGNVHRWDLKEGKESLKFMTVVFTLVTYNDLLLDMYDFEKVLTTQICRILRFLELCPIHSLLATRLLTPMGCKILYHILRQCVAFLE